MGCARPPLRVRSEAARASYPARRPTEAVGMTALWEDAMARIVSQLRYCRSVRPPIAIVLTFLACFSACASDNSTGSMEDAVRALYRGDTPTVITYSNRMLEETDLRLEDRA